jgi:hypothetical protein
MSGEDPTIVLLICVAGLSVGRVFAMLTTSIVAVYLIMACVIIALGVMNTAMASACSRLADADQVNMKLCVMMIRIPALEGGLLLAKCFIAEY